MGSRRRPPVIGSLLVLLLLMHLLLRRLCKCRGRTVALIARYRFAVGTRHILLVLLLGRGRWWLPIERTLLRMLHLLVWRRYWLPVPVDQTWLGRLHPLLWRRLWLSIESTLLLRLLHLLLWSSGPQRIIGICGLLRRGWLAVLVGSDGSGCGSIEADQIIDHRRCRRSVATTGSVHFLHAGQFGCRNGLSFGGR